MKGGHIFTEDAYSLQHMHNLLDLDLLQMRKAADERANAVDKKLVEMSAVQRQIGEQVSGLREMVKKSAEETKQAMDRQRDQILGALVEDTTELIAALDLNENALGGAHR